jgi:hypothetical protein
MQQLGGKRLSIHALSVKVAFCNLLFFAWSRIFVYTKRRWMSWLASSFVVLSFCAHATDKPKAPIKTVALIEARDTPVEFDIAVSFFAPIGVRFAANGRAQGYIEEEMPKFKAAGYSPSKAFNDALIKALEGAGVKVVAVKGLERSESSPNEIKYPQVKHDADAILHLGIEELAFEAPRGQDAFWPRANSWAYVYSKDGKERLLNAEAAHRRDYQEGKDPGLFQTTQAMSFASEKAMVEDPKKFSETFNQILKAQAEHVAKELLKQWPK